MNPPGWPPGYGPSSQAPPSGTGSTNEWGVPVQPVYGQPGGFGTTPSNNFATTPTSEPSFQPAPYAYTAPSAPVSAPSTSDPMQTGYSNSSNSSTEYSRGLITPIPGAPKQTEVYERPSSEPNLPNPGSSSSMAVKRDPKAVFSATRKPLEVVSTPKAFILRLRDSPSKILQIERKNSHPGQYMELETPPNVTSKIAVYNAYGILGIVVLQSENGEAESYLMLITGVEVVGTIQQIPVYRIVQTALVTFHPRNEYFYSQMPKPPFSMMKDFIESGLFYFSLDYHLTHTQQRLAALDTESEPMHRLADRRFFWNRFLARSFVNKRLDDFVTVVIRGNVAIAEGQHLPESRKECELAIISRLSCMRAGTRYNARGVNDNGDVGNFVESEQILITSNRVSSFVQIRGSVPVFWEEPLLKSGHTPTLARTPEASTPAFKRHFDDLLGLYERVHIINLLAKKKKELVVAEAYEDQLTRWKGLDSEKIRYTHFDFHAECAKGYENISRLVNARIVKEDLVAHFGYFAKDPSSGNVLSQQHGIFRTNCLDCLDRTNVTQTALGREMLSLQIRDSDGSNGIVSDQTRLGVALNEMWADNGDALSKAYTGTGAMKSSYTRKGKHTLAGMLDDGLKSVTRFYINTFKDSDNQVAVDLFLGKIEELVDEEQPAEDTWVKEKMRDRISEYTTVNGHNVFIATYNCNAKPPPFSDGKFAIDELLDPVRTSFDDIDIWVFGFQEIVDLNVGQTLWSTDTSNPAAWESALANRLNDLRKSNRVVLLRSAQLVGIHVAVFVAERELQHFRDLNVETVKVGWKGVAGNKGAACLSFSFYDSSFCFICAHLAAGHKEYEVRASDYKTITGELKFGLSKNYGKTIADHEYAFWLGDFNWRIDLTYYEVIQKVYERNWEYLLRFDQMKRAVREGAAFSGFEEGVVAWAPTYKYDPGLDQYDTSELKRIPAWTDRIVWKAQDPTSVQNLLYTRCEIIWSDHRPVKGLYRLSVKTVNKPQARRIKDSLYHAVKSMDPAEVEAQIRIMREARGGAATGTMRISKLNPSVAAVTPLPTPVASSSSYSTPPVPKAAPSVTQPTGTPTGQLVDIGDAETSSNSGTQPRPGMTMQTLPNGPLTPHYIKIMNICAEYLKCYGNVQLIMTTSNALATAIKQLLDYVDTRPDVNGSVAFKQELTAAVQKLAVHAREAAKNNADQQFVHALAIQAKVVTEIIKAQLSAFR